MPASPLPARYVGRYAPSPTGPLHFGSLIAAVGSCLDARRHDGNWLLRLEDVDRPRCRPAAAHNILRTLAAFGFEWDGEVLVQSRRHAEYDVAFIKLREAGRTFPCSCTRSEMADSRLQGPLSLASDGAQIYPGTCRAGLAPGKLARSWRLRVGTEVIDFDDAVQGHFRQELAGEAGDFVLLRADGLFAYQLAVVVDDAAQGITHVVRGADLLDSTPRQILLERLLGIATPCYAHLPVALNSAGEKLSKQTHAAPLDPKHPQAALVGALKFLGQTPPGELSSGSLSEIWEWARKHWDLARVPHRLQLAAE